MSTHSGLDLAVHGDGVGIGRTHLIAARSSELSGMWRRLEPRGFDLFVQPAFGMEPEVYRRMLRDCVVTDDEALAFDLDAYMERASPDSATTGPSNTPFTGNTAFTGEIQKPPAGGVDS